MTITHYETLLRNDERGRCWLESYQVKTYPTPNTIGLSVRMWRIIENGRVVKDQLLRKPTKKQLTKYM